MTDGVRLTRRGLAGAALAIPAAAAAEPAPLPIPPAMLRQGEPVEPGRYGTPASSEAGIGRRMRLGEQPLVGTAGSYMTPLGELDGTITPSGLNYVRNHAGTPTIAPDTHRLLLHGLVERPLLFTMADLLRFPTVSRTYFLECAGNSSGLYQAARLRSDWTVQDTHGLLSCAEWTGVRLADVLAEAGVRPGAAWVLAEGADAAGLTRSFPLDKALDDALLVWGQNGERLRPEQGYPLRLLLPGFEGSMSVKWLRRLKLGDQPWMTREETSKYTGLRPDGTAVQFNFPMRVKSVITRPSGGQRIAAPGFCEITGIAWSGRGRVARVEVSTDGGAAWRDAALEPPILSKSLTRFRLPWRWDGNPALLLSRATDETGETQPARAELLAGNGPNHLYHWNAIQHWQVEASGAVRIAI